MTAANVVQLPKSGDSLLGKYILEKPLGQGGMGVVYAARHELLGQRVAVKFLLPEIAAQGDSVARFLNEARAASRIESDHIARVLDVGLVEGALPYMVLEFLDGDDLAMVLRKRGPLPIAEVADFMLQAIDALAYAHSLGIVHRDLKPSNLFLVQRQDGTARLKVLDFGISKLIGAQSLGGDILTRTNAMLGSPLYMSPEQLRDSKSVDHRCDIWALGVIAYELLTSHPPFMADNAVALFAAIHETEPVSARVRRPDGSIPPELERAILGCLRRNPNERFSSVTELAAALAPFATDIGIRAFQNVKRVLPLRAPVAANIPTEPQAPASALPPPVSPATTHSAHPIVAPSAPHASTANPWARSQTGAVSTVHKRGLMIVALGLGGLLGLAGALAGTRYVMLHRHGEEPTATLATGPTSNPLPAASTVPDIASSTAASAATPSAAASAAPPPPAAGAPSSLSSARPQAPALAARSSPAPRAVVGVAPPTAAAAASASPPPRPPPNAVAPPRNCDPPYTIDSVGHHVLKPGCE